jgi:hypothetical protein
MKAEPYPPPYKRMLALNSDVEFTTWSAQLELLRLVGERGLETAFSYWLFSDPTYTWRLVGENGEWSKEAPVALQLARQGIFDTLHSFGGASHIGGIAFDREDIRQGYARLTGEGVATKVYSNHGTDKDVQNIGGVWAPPRVPPIDFRNYWAGDLNDHASYHLDLTLGYGMRFFWLDIDRIRHRAWFEPSVDTGDADLFTTQISRDGSPILRFKRTDFNETPWPTTLAAQLNRALDDPSSGYCVVYNHFGFMRTADDRPVPNPSPFFDEPGYAAIARLMDAQKAGDVLVTTTSRLLNFALMQTLKPWKIEQTESAILVEFSETNAIGAVPIKLGWDELMGFAIAIDDAAPPVELRLGGERRRAQLWTIGGQTYAGIPWAPLKIMDALDDALRTA